MRGNDAKTYRQPDARETEQFWTKICQPREHNKKAEWISNITKELEELEEGPKVEIQIDLLKTNQIGKRQAMIEYTDFRSRNPPPFKTD